jgi:hypothetical protein
MHKVKCTQHLCTGHQATITSNALTATVAASTAATTVAATTTAEATPATTAVTRGLGLVHANLTTLQLQATSHMQRSSTEQCEAHCGAAVDSINQEHVLTGPDQRDLPRLVNQISIQCEIVSVHPYKAMSSCSERPQGC